MKRFFQFLSYWIGKTYPSKLADYVAIDKYCHFVSSVLGGAILNSLLYQINPVFLTCIVSTIIISALAAFKEVWDDLHKEIHTPDVWDWIASSFGGLLGSVLVYLVL